MQPGALPFPRKEPNARIPVNTRPISRHIQWLRIAIALIPINIAPMHAATRIRIAVILPWATFPAAYSNNTFTTNATTMTITICIPSPQAVSQVYANGAKKPVGWSCGFSPRNRRSAMGFQQQVVPLTKKRQLIQSAAV